MSNTNKFLAGFNPTNAAAYLHIISVATSSTNIIVTYLGASGDTNYVPGRPVADECIGFHNRWRWRQLQQWRLAGHGSDQYSRRWNIRRWRRRDRTRHGHQHDRYWRRGQFHVAILPHPGPAVEPDSRGHD
jgi:hypothetical protein